MRILMADDHAMLRCGLRRIMADAFPGAVIAEAATCDDLLAAVRESDWSVLVLDIALGDRNSLELIPSCASCAVQMPIVVLSMYKERQFVIRALRARRWRVLDQGSRAGRTAGRHSRRLGAQAVS